MYISLDSMHTQSIFHHDTNFLIRYHYAKLVYETSNVHGVAEKNHIDHESPLQLINYNSFALSQLGTQFADTSEITVF